ncbi:hypothetical protein Y013_12590 [Rhodococcus pyridinivorans SB3094]|uniref:Uncharacterized protein n=1 Tax=Rhodococcus pyridinivorans SB3094 TaxID=1435356 RepID=V9XJX3_9NOCA|nr:hypothetical protein Y013_12590 [Rhodococcus pyridinivorans SB3094]
MIGARGTDSTSSTLRSINRAAPDDEGDVGDIADEQTAVVDGVHDVATSETGLSCDPIAEMGHGAAEK